MKKVPIACRVDPRIIKALDKSADLGSRSRAGQLEFILRKYFADNETKNLPGMVRDPRK